MNKVTLLSAEEESRGGKKFKTTKGAVYTAFVAPSRPKNKSVTDGRTDEPTDGRTHAHIEALRRD